MFNGLGTHKKYTKQLIALHKCRVGCGHKGATHLHLQQPFLHFYPMSTNMNSCEGESSMSNFL